MTAKDIQGLLKYRHAKDVYVPECKNGSTWFAEHLRLDGLAIARSCVSPIVTGYEIKVSRSDFLRDQKVNAYLKYCNALYFVCPYRMIMPDEIPEQMGLLWVASTGSRLYTKKKAPYRQIEEPAELYKYILISRAKILDRDIGETRGPTDREYWEGWLKKKEIDREFGYRVSRAIASHVDSEITRVQEINENMKYEHERIQEALTHLENEGIDITVHPWSINHQVTNKIRKIKGGLPVGFEAALRRTLEGLQTVANTLSEDGARSV